MPSEVPYVPYIYQPISILPEQKKDKSPPPGAFLYNDVFNSYRAFEHLYLLAQSPGAYLLGFGAGVFKGGMMYNIHGAPKKIAQDGEMIDFGSKVHSSGFGAMVKIFAKRFFFGIWPAANIDRFGVWATKDIEQIAAQEVRDLTNGLKHAFIIYKAAQLGDEIIQRIANWADVPAK